MSTSSITSTASLSSAKSFEASLICRCKAFLLGLPGSLIPSKFSIVFSIRDLSELGVVTTWAGIRLHISVTPSYRDKRCCQSARQGC